MRQLVITSGKGGTGKTTVTAGFVVLAGEKVVADADVEAPNQHLLLNPQIVEKREYKGAKMAVKDAEKCEQCGKCEEYCRFNAIRDMEVEPTGCEGCGVCVFVCPTGALRLEEVTTGATMISKTDYGSFSHALLEIGAEGSGKLITEVRRNAEKIMQDEPLLLIDGPPGIGCPVIASLTGADLALIVSEPSVSGRHDLERIHQVTQHFNVKALVCINKWDLSPEMSKNIEKYCEDEGINLVGKIPFDPQVMDVYKQDLPVEHLLQTKAGEAIEEIWENVREHILQ
ncbi:MAG: ATP-binding protein [Syntrophaceticus sp.]|nr:ATP-binding protein [Syntrophaceticus sp.]MDD3315555.1 ATP-binding protein [Syntrophaceticus sp.]MDD4360595.1 ATP-binding protein [Syntrophaceticus sp.]MDD4783818.1 ATP-binding protein [Syntrophaceticus sp.]